MELSDTVDLILKCVLLLNEAELLAKYRYRVLLTYQNNQYDAHPKEYRALRISIVIFYLENS